MEQLKDEIQNLSDEHLIDLSRFHREEYTPEAQELIDTEIKRRNLDNEKIPLDSKSKKVGPHDLDSEDFILFDHVFNRIDLELAIAMLREKDIVFYVSS